MKIIFKTRVMNYSYRGSGKRSNDYHKSEEPNYFEEQHEKNKVEKGNRLPDPEQPSSETLFRDTQHANQLQNVTITQKKLQLLPKQHPLEIIARFQNPDLLFMYLETKNIEQKNKGSIIQRAEGLDPKTKGQVLVNLSKSFSNQNNLKRIHPEEQNLEKQKKHSKLKKKLTQQIKNRIESAYTPEKTYRQVYLQIGKTVAYNTVRNHLKYGKKNDSEIKLSSVNQ